MSLFCTDDCNIRSVVIHCVYADGVSQRSPVSGGGCGAGGIGAGFPKVGNIATLPSQGLGQGRPTGLLILFGAGVDGGGALIDAASY